GPPSAADAPGSGSADESAASTSTVTPYAATATAGSASAAGRVPVRTPVGGRRSRLGVRGRERRVHVDGDAVRGDGDRG
ncbi:hypothetical protein PN419_18075, partial [Halorubrum ezzemoulense]|uniref:hypothetical protein n=1 Tax=Halorubrum ezzemoulense TaxID=337243 RepID=UPI00232B77A1